MNFTISVFLRKIDNVFIIYNVHENDKTSQQKKTSNTLLIKIPIKEFTSQ